MCIACGVVTSMSREYCTSRANSTSLAACNEIRSASTSEIDVERPHRLAVAELGDDVGDVELQVLVGDPVDVVALDVDVRTGSEAARRRLGDAQQPVALVE